MKIEGEVEPVELDVKRKFQRVPKVEILLFKNLRSVLAF
jgi:hypothetical protein